MSTIEYQWFILQKIYVEADNPQHLKVMNHTGINTIISGILQIEYFTPDEVKSDVYDAFCKQMNPYQWYFNIENIQMFENYLSSGVYDQPALERLFIQMYQHHMGRQIHSESSMRRLEAMFSHAPIRTQIRSLAVRVHQNASDYLGVVEAVYQYVYHQFQLTSQNHTLLTHLKQQGWIMTRNLKENADGSIMIQVMRSMDENTTPT